MSGLLVIGDVVTDILALPKGPVSAGVDVDAEIAMLPGGSGANTAAWAARLGAPTRMLARVGEDSGRWHAEELRRAGVDTCLRFDPAQPTATVIALIDPTGERSMLTNRGAGGLLGVEDWDPALLDGIAHLHLSGYVLFAPSGLALAGMAITAARARGVTISVDPASTGFLTGFGVKRFLQVTAALNLVIPNRDEVRMLTGSTDPEAAAEKLSSAYGLAVVKLGADGAIAARGGRIVARAEATAERVLDSTGAGDAFAAGFLAARLSGADEEEALRAGCRAGGKAVGLFGGRPPPPGPAPSPDLA
ncbi:carbohydrate kinase family protein [Rhizohabitans arisaemae]|uniref:carbohydrate kinase family protein n=1 Tax=Rhizohabitans arisaemae TaxID=2720610 RepID=UPI0024B1B96E|nr:sugar kinase [Rhizohabitans arisaemae]